MVETMQVVFTGSAKEAIELELRNAIREFCVRTNAWTIFERLTLVKDKQIYSISPTDDNAVITTIIAVAIGGRPVQGWSGDYLPPENLRNLSGYVTNPDPLIEDEINTVRLGSSYVGNIDQSFIVTMACRPKRDRLYIPDMLGFDFFDTIVEGATARMHEHINRAYTDADGAYRKRRQFMAGLTRARQKTKNRFSKLATPWAFPQTAPGRRYR
jgi:hypothetical protein